LITLVDKYCFCITVLHLAVTAVLDLGKSPIVQYPWQHQSVTLLCFLKAVTVLKTNFNVFSLVMVLIMGLAKFSFKNILIHF